METARSDGFLGVMFQLDDQEVVAPCHVKIEPMRRSWLDKGAFEFVYVSHARASRADLATASTAAVFRSKPEYEFTIDRAAIQRGRRTRVCSAGGRHHLLHSRKARTLR